MKSINSPASNVFDGVHMGVREQNKGVRIKMPRLISIKFEGMRQRNLRSHPCFVSERLSKEADRSHVRT